jgi:hypothetical protein
LPCTVSSLDVAAPGDLDRAPAEPVLLFDANDVAALVLVGADRHVVYRVGAATVDRYELDGRTWLVYRRDHDASTRQLDLEGDAPGRFEYGHRGAYASLGGLFLRTRLAEVRPRIARRRSPRSMSLA